MAQECSCRVTMGSRTEIHKGTPPTLCSIKAVLLLSPRNICDYYLASINISLVYSLVTLYSLDIHIMCVCVCVGSVFQLIYQYEKLRFRSSVAITVLSASNLLR